MTEQQHDIARRPTKPPPGKTGTPPPSGTIAKQLEITVILDEPIEKDDKWELTSKEYNKTLTVNDAEPLVKGAKILRFKVKPTKTGYTLTHYRSNASKRMIFRDRPVPPGITPNIRPLSARDAYAQIDSQVPRKLLDKYMTEVEVDRDLVQKCPVLVDLKVEDPEL